MANFRRKYDEYEMELYIKKCECRDLTILITKYQQVNVN